MPKMTPGGPFRGASNPGGGPRGTSGGRNRAKNVPWRAVPTGLCIRAAASAHVDSRARMSVALRFEVCAFGRVDARRGIPVTGELMPPVRRRPARAPAARPPSQRGGPRGARGPPAHPTGAGPPAERARQSQADALAANAGAAAGPEVTAFRYVAPRSKARPASPTVAPDHSLLAWVRRAVSLTPPRLQPQRHAGALAQELAAAGITGPWDLAGLADEEITLVFPCLAGVSTEFVSSLQRACTSLARPGPRDERPLNRQLASKAVALVEDEHGVATARAALQVLAVARRDRCALAPDVLADAVVALSRMPASGMQVLRQGDMQGVPERPGDRASWLQNRATVDHTLAFRELVLREFQSWHRSGIKYVSAVRLWGRVAASIDEPPWPPTEVLLGAFAFAVRNGNTLNKYVSQIRSVLRLVGIPAGVLADTAALARGAAKGVEPKYKARASARQTRDLARYIRDTLNEPMIADSFVVARQFCLRYASEVIPLSRNSAHSAVRISERGGLAEATLRFHRRKGCRETVAVVRRCICAQQTPELCGVCILKKSVSAVTFSLASAMALRWLP